MLRFDFLFLRPFVAVGLWIGAFLAPALGAKKSEADRPPELISTDGSPKWKNLADLKRLAGLGEPEAQYELGNRMLTGDGVPRDPSGAVRLLEKAAEQGVADAWFRLGKVYHDGADMPRNYVRSFECYTEAARRGLPEAQHNLGAMLVSARGVKRDYVEGLAWFIVSAKFGAVSSAEQQTRERLAKRADLIAQAEERAKELLAQLKDGPAAVQPRVTFPGLRTAPPPVARPSVPTAPVTPNKVEIAPPPALEAPKPQLPPTLSLPPITLPPAAPPVPGPDKKS